MNFSKKIFIVLLSLAICSCSTDININTVNKDITDNILSVQTRTTIKGKAEFPVYDLLTPSPSLNNREGGNSSHSTVNSSPPLTKGVGGFSSSSPLTTKATVTDVGSNATVSLITPQEHPTTPNKTIATGLTDNNGNFTINPNTSFNPAVNEIFVLEATKRIGSSGQDLISIRTYIKWTGSSWISMTKNFNDNTYPIYINTKTTALSLIAAINSDISPVHTIGTINIASGSSVPTNITGDNSYTLDAQVITDTAQKVEVLLGSNLDPTHIIKYDPVLNNYIPSRPENPQKILLINTKNCPNCSLFGEDLSNLDLSNGDLTNADLTGAKITGANFSNVDMTSIKGYNENINDFSNFNFTNTNLSNTTLTGATMTGTTLTGATLTGANVTGANFSNVDMTSIKGYNGNTNDFSFFNFSSANLSNTTLTGATFTGANFSNVDMTKIIGSNGRTNDFSFFDFSSANLSGVNLTDTCLNNSNLTGANLAGANLDKTNLSAANLSGAHLIFAYLDNVIMSQANLSDANLENARLINVNLSSADLTNADLIGADLRGVNLSGANLSGALWWDGHTCKVDNAFDGLCD